MVHSLLIHAIWKQRKWPGWAQRQDAQILFVTVMGSTAFSRGLWCRRDKALLCSYLHACIFRLLLSPMTVMVKPFLYSTKMLLVWNLHRTLIYQKQKQLSAFVKKKKLPRIDLFIYKVLKMCFGLINALLRQNHIMKQTAARKDIIPFLFLH